MQNIYGAVYRAAFTYLSTLIYNGRIRLALFDCMKLLYVLFAKGRFDTKTSVEDLVTLFLWLNIKRLKNTNNGYYWSPHRTGRIQGSAM